MKLAILALLLAVALASCDNPKEQALRAEKEQNLAEVKALQEDIARAQESHDMSQEAILHERNLLLQRKAADWTNRARAAGWKEK